MKLTGNRRWAWIVRVYLGIWFRYRDGKVYVRAARRW